MSNAEKFWDRISSNYEKQPIADEKAYNQTIENTKKYLRSSDTILDFGCGTGSISIILSERVLDVFAIDISSKMIEIAKRKTDERGIKNIRYLKASIFDERLKKVSFNVITAFHILHLVQDTKSVLQRVAELLKPGGVFVSMTPCFDGKWRFLGVFMIPLSKLGILPYVNMIKSSELKQTVIDYNFEILEIKKNKTSQEYFIIAKKK